MSNWQFSILDNVVLMKGSKIKCTSPMEFESTLVPMGAVLEVIVSSRKDDREYVSVKSDVRIKGWHTCDGKTEEGHGWKIFSKALLHNSGKFAVVNPEMEIINDIEFKGIKLRGMKCRIVYITLHRDGHRVFVETQKDVGGGSCDGKCRIGYGVSLREEDLCQSKEKTK